MSEHTHTALVEGCFRCDLNRDELATVHRDLLAEYDAAGKPPLCDRCGGYRTSDGDWEVIPTCAESPLRHDEICTEKRYLNDVCDPCRVQLGWEPLAAAAAGLGPVRPDRTEKP